MRNIKPYIGVVWTERRRRATTTNVTTVLYRPRPLDAVLDQRGEVPESAHRDGVVCLVLRPVRVARRHVRHHHLAARTNVGKNYLGLRAGKGPPQPQSLSSSRSENNNNQQAASHQLSKCALHSPATAKTTPLAVLLSSPAHCTWCQACPTPGEACRRTHTCRGRPHRAVEHQVTSRSTKSRNNRIHIAAPLYRGGVQKSVRHNKMRNRPRGIHPSSPHKNAPSVHVTPCHTSPRT